MIRFDAYSATARGLKPEQALPLFWKVGDVKIIDGGGPNGMAFLSRVFAGRLSKVQSGYVYHYAFVMLLGVAGFLAFAIYAWGA